MVPADGVVHMEKDILRTFHFPLNTQHNGSITEPTVVVSLNKLPIVHKELAQQEMELEQQIQQQNQELEQLKHSDVTKLPVPVLEYVLKS